MAVDETRHHGGAAAVEHVAGEAVELAGGREPGDAAVLDEHRMAVRHPLAVEDPSSAIECGHACLPCLQPGSGARRRTRQFIDLAPVKFRRGEA